MSQQYDQQAGLDISSLASVSPSQLLQMINQLAPLSNIGGIICFAGNAAGAAGVGYPDVTNNPRFIRYLWIDTANPLLPSVKSYKGIYSGTPANPSAMSNLYTDWTGGVLSINAGDIVTVMVSLASANGGIWLGQIKRASNGAIDNSKASNLVTLDANGQFVVENSFLAYLILKGGIPLDYINANTGGVNKYLGYNLGGSLLGEAGQIKYKYLDPANDIKAAFGNQIPPSSMQPGNNGQVMTTQGGAVSWQTPSAGGSFIGCYAYLSVNGGIGSGVLYHPLFTSELWDTDNIHDNTANQDRLVCKTAGKYSILGQAYFQSNGFNTIYTVSILKNGVFVATTKITDGSANEALLQCSGIIDLAVNDYIQLEIVRQSTAIPATVIGAGSNRTFLEMHLIGQ